MHPQIFFQLKGIFHLLESLGSARIEGNRTTVAEYLDTTIASLGDEHDHSLREIENMEKALSHIDEALEQGSKISRSFILDLHKITVAGLLPPPRGEGDKTPGQFRTVNVKINKSKHVPPDSLHVLSLMDELVEFINKKNPQQCDLLKTAVAHHRFAWIHPFGNGNGRVVRLLTYAMLVTQGFQVHKAGRIINPTAVFCNDRNKYFDMLSVADTYESKNILKWCEYVLGGLEHEVIKIDRLLDLEYTTKKIIIPAIEFCLERQRITKKEADYLKIMAGQINLEIQSRDFKKLDPSQVNRSRFIGQLKEKKLILANPKSPRKYILQLHQGPLAYGVVQSLSTEGFMEGIEVGT